MLVVGGMIYLSMSGMILLSAIGDMNQTEGVELIEEIMQDFMPRKVRLLSTGTISSRWAKY